MKIEKNIMIFLFLALFMDVSCADNNETKNDNNLTSVRESNMTNKQKILALIAEKKAAKVARDKAVESKNKAVESLAKEKEENLAVRMAVAAH